MHLSSNTRAMTLALDPLSGNSGRSGRRSTTRDGAGSLGASPAEAFAGAPPMMGHERSTSRAASLVAQDASNRRMARAAHTR